MVHVPGGLVPIEQVKVGTMVVSCAGRARAVTRVVLSRARRWVRVKTQTGRQVLATHDHPLLIQDGWARAVSLVVGDRLVTFAPNGPGAAGTLWSDERAWQGRRTRIDPRTLKAGPFPVPNLRDAARFDAIVEVTQIDEPGPLPAHDLELEADGGFVVAGVLVRASATD